MLRSKLIKDYFEAPFSSLVANKTLTFGVHLYFSKNTHVVLLLQRGLAPEATALERYAGRGLKTVWIHREDEAAYQTYIAAPVTAVEEPVAASEEEAAPAAVVTAPSEPEIPQEKKVEIASKAAMKALHEAFTAETREAQKAKDDALKEMVEDLLTTASTHVESVVAEIWDLADGDEALEHGITTATYAVVLAMAFGRIDAQLIADIAYAALIHDVGLTQIPIANIPVLNKGFAPKGQDPYRSHPDNTLAMIKEFNPGTNPRVYTIIGQHHEKFDGSGFPAGLKGFRVDDIAQILSLANILAHFSVGDWDGKTRTLREAFDEIEKMEKVRTFPEYFNPEVLSAIMKWTKNQLDDKAMEKAASVVEDQARDMVQKRPA